MFDGKLEEDDFDSIPMLQSGRRCGVQFTPWMGDWFTSWSPRNDNENSEGPWDHWVDLAIKILQDPFTESVRPDAYETAKGLSPLGFYSETKKDLTKKELEERFKNEGA